MIRRPIGTNREPEAELSVELLDLEPSSAEPPADPISESREMKMVIAGIAVFVLGLVVGSALSDSGQQDTTSPVPSSNGSVAVDTLRVPTAAQTSADTHGFVAWPDPPKDHDPHVIGVPGPDVALLGVETDATLVYVNSLGRPTILDLDTGSVSEIEVAATREIELFAVELNEVVSLDGSSLNLPPSGDRAVVFFTHNPLATPPLETGADSRVPMPAVHLCLSPAGCDELDWLVGSIGDGTDTIVHVDWATNADVAEILFGESWVADGRYLIAPISVGEGIRIPAPLGENAWLLHQPAI